MNFYIVYRNTHRSPINHGPYLVSTELDGVQAKCQADAGRIAAIRNPTHSWETLAVVVQTTSYGSARSCELAEERNRQIDEMRELCEGLVV